MDKYPRSLALAGLCLFLYLAPLAAQSGASGDGSLGSATSASDAAIGVASWYGADFHGRPTSNGEIYDKEKLSCAHRTYPFGTYLLVRNLDNGSSVVVRVNDRGPFAKNRIIDLSEAAARLIGMIPTGTARVSLTVIPREEALAWKGSAPDGSTLSVDEGAPSASSGSAASGTVAAKAQAADEAAYLRIQVASYAVEANAKATLERLAASGLSASIETAAGKYRVVFSRLSSADARLVSTRLDSLGYRGYIVTTVRAE
jgi:rare lipoprotein A